MKPVQKLANTLLKIATGQSVSEAERSEAADCYGQVQTLISPEMFLNLARVIEEDWPNQHALRELGARWVQRFEVCGGCLSEADARVFLLENNVRTDMRRLLSLPVLATCSEQRRGQPLNEQMHRLLGQSGWVFLYSCSGEGSLGTGDRTFRTSTGDCFLFGPEAIYDYHLSPGAECWRYYWVHFQCPEAWSRWLHWPEVGREVYHLRLESAEVVSRLDGLCAEICMYANSRCSLDRDLAQALLQQVLILCQKFCPITQDAEVDERIQRARDFIVQHYREPITLAQVAEAAFTSVSRLSSLFKEAVGVGPIAWRDEIRLLKACQMLREERLSIAQVAAEVGYDDPAFFHRFFKRRIGASPRDYRQNFRDR